MRLEFTSAIGLEEIGINGVCARHGSLIVIVKDENRCFRNWFILCEASCYDALV